MLKCALRYGDTLQIELEFGNAGFRGEEKIGVPGQKPLEARSTRTNNTLNPNDTESGNRTRATLVGEECSTAPSLLPI